MQWLLWGYRGGHDPSRGPYPARRRPPRGAGPPVPLADHGRPQGRRSVDGIHARRAHRPGRRQRQPPPQGARGGRAGRGGARAGPRPARALVAPGGAGTRWSRRDLVDPAAVDAALEAEALALRRQQERVRDWMANADTDPSGTTSRSPPSTGCGSPRTSCASCRTRWSGAAPLGQPDGARGRRAPRAGATSSPAASRASREPRAPDPAPSAPPLAGNRNFRLLWAARGSRCSAR